MADCKAAVPCTNKKTVPEYSVFKIQKAGANSTAAEAQQKRKQKPMTAKRTEKYVELGGERK